MPIAPVVVFESKTKMKKTFLRSLKKTEIGTAAYRASQLLHSRDELIHTLRLDDAIDSYSQQYGADPALLKNDMLREYVFRGFTPDEYLAFRFLEKNRKKRKEYISIEDTYRLFFQTHRNQLPAGKYARYQLFQKFYKRQAIAISFDGSEEESVRYNSFINTCDRFVLKPLKGEKGHGVRLLSSQEIQDLTALHSEYGGACILEEVIEAGTELGRFHPESINTLRLVTGLNSKG